MNNNIDNNIDNEILLSIAIPTWNRASCLKNLLNSILPQAEKLEEKIEICISNNSSTDNTREVVMRFKGRYPSLINYNENEKNLGADANILKVLEMSSGKFTWTIGDDDNIINDGLEKVVSFIKKECEENIGLIILKTESYFVDKKTGKQIIYNNTSNKNKPEAFKIDRRDIIGLSFPDIGFISSLIFNNKFLKRIWTEDHALIERGVGTGHSHMILYVVMFLKYPYINGIAFNKVIVRQELPQYKYFIEDKYALHYQVQKKLNNLLLHNKYMNDNYAYLIRARNKGLELEFVSDMMVMRAFKNYNYFSYFSCLKLFFQYSTLTDALLFSSVFSVLFLIPPIVLTSLYKILLIIKYGKKWKIKWILINDLYSILSQGDKRRSVY